MLIFSPGVTAIAPPSLKPLVLDLNVLVNPHQPPHHASSVIESACLIPAPPPPTKKTSTQCTPAGTVRIVEEVKVRIVGLEQDTDQSAQLVLSAGLSATQVFHDFTNHSSQI